MFKGELKLYCIALSTDCSFMLFIFTVTRLMAENRESLLTLGILGTVSSMGYALGAPIGGRVFDLWGERRVITVGAATQLLVLLACMQWHSSNHWLYLMGAITGASVGCLHPPVIARLTQGGLSRLGSRLTGRRLFRFCLSWNLGMIGGQIVGGWLFPFNPTLPLLVGVLLMVGVLILVRLPLTIPAPDSFPEAEQEVPVTPKTARTFVYLGWLANVASAMGLSVIIHLFPHLATELEISPPTHGMMLAANRLTVIAIYSLMYCTTFWRYRVFSALLVQLCALAGLTLLVYSRAVLFLTIGLVLFGLLSGYNYFSSIFYSTTTFGGQRQGIASGMHEASLALGFAAGALGGGLVSLWLGPRAPYQTVALVVVLTALVRSWVHWKARRGTDWGQTLFFVDKRGSSE